MAKREWVGIYYLYFQKYLSYKDMYVWDSHCLGYCLGVDEACEKSVNFIIRENFDVNYDTMYVMDGWGNKIYAKER